MWDVSSYEAMTTSFVVYAHLYAAYASDARTGATRSIEIPSVELAKDGWVGFCTITGQQFKDFCVVIDDPEMAEDPRLSQRRRADGPPRRGVAAHRPLHQGPHRG